MALGRGRAEGMGVGTVNLAGGYRSTGSSMTMGCVWVEATQRMWNHDGLGCLGWCF